MGHTDRSLPGIASKSKELCCGGDWHLINIIGLTVTRCVMWSCVVHCICIGIWSLREVTGSRSSSHHNVLSGMKVQNCAKLTLIMSSNNNMCLYTVNSIYRNERSASFSSSAPVFKKRALKVLKISSLLLHKGHGFLSQFSDPPKKLKCYCGRLKQSAKGGDLEFE